MIDRLMLIDFQAHERLLLKLDPRITTIVGPSDVGKSSVVRALRWLAFNRPLGDGFVRRGAEFAQVKARVDGRTVGRMRGKGRNLYFLDADGLEAFGNDVPSQVSDLLRLGLDNVAGQHDSPFWFGLTAGDVGRELNRIVSLDLIDKTLARATSAVRQAKARREMFEEQVREDEALVERLAWVPEVKGRLDELEAESRRLAEQAERVSVLGMVICETKVWLRKQTQAGARLGDGRAAVEAGREAGTAAKRVVVLRELVGECRRAAREAARRPPAGLEGRVGRLMAEAQEAERAACNLRMLIGAYVAKRREVASAVRALAKAKAQLETETEGVCPLCGGVLK